MGLRGLRTACQARSRYRTDLRPVANRLVCNRALESQHFGSCRRTIEASIPVAAMMKATGWHQHSVRGFLAGVVRKRLKLKLGSTKVDGNRVYLTTKGDAGKTIPARQPKRDAA